MSPPSQAKQEESGQGFRHLLAQKFVHIAKYCDYYLFTDMDDIAIGTIKNDIRALENLPRQYSRSRKSLPVEIRGQFINIATKIEQQVARIIPTLYSARRARQIEDMDVFYIKIQKSRKYWKKIRDLLIAELG